MEARDFSDLIAKVTDAIIEAYCRGLKDGQQSATELVIDALHSGSPSARHPEPETAPDPKTVERQSARSNASGVERRSVESRIQEYLDAQIDGKKVADISAETGISESSVRGALNRLQQKGTAAKRNELWQSRRAISDRGSPDTEI